MFKRISLLNKRGFFQKKDNFYRGFLFSPLLIIPLFLVIISGLLIKSIQGDFLVSNYLGHLLTGFFSCFTSFSGFIYYLYTILNQGDWIKFIIFFNLIIVVNLLAMFVGFWISRKIT